MSDVTATDFPLSSGHGRPAVCLWATSRRRGSRPCQKRSNRKIVVA